MSGELTRRLRLPEPVCGTQSIHEAALALLDPIGVQGRRLRLTGVSVTELGGPPQPKLLPEPGLQRRRKVDELMLEINDRFGDAGLKRAALIGKTGR